MSGARLSGIRCFSTLPGIGAYATAVSAVPGSDQGQGGVRSEVRTAKLSLRAARTRTERPGGFQRAVARLGVGSGQPARAREDPRTGGGGLGCRTVPLAAQCRTSQLFVPRWRTAEGSPRRVRRLAGEPVLGAVAACGKEVWVREMAGEVEVLDGGERIAVHPRAARKHGEW